MELDFIRRSVLSVPASGERMIAKARTLRVDQVLLDLEDSVSPDMKSTARKNLSILNHSDFVAPVVSVRINSLATDWVHGDFEQLKSGVGSWIDSVMIPKASTVDDITLVDSELARIEKSLGRDLGSIAIDVQIESARGLVNCEAIARSPRVQSLNFGPADFMADIGMTSEEVTSNKYALMRTLVAARAAGILTLDGPTLEVRDLSKFEASAQIAAEMGCDGKWVLHPDQIESCHKIFTPSQERFDEASCLLEAYQHFTSSSGGSKGAAIYKGAMIDEASRKMALAVWRRGDAAGLKANKHFTP